MATPPLQPAPFTRMVHPDPVTNKVVQDLYDKLAQAWKEINALKQK